MPRRTGKYVVLSPRPYRKKGSQKKAAGPFDVREALSRPPPARMVLSSERSSSEVRESMLCGTQRLLVV